MTDTVRDAMPEYNPWDPAVQERLDEYHEELRQRCPVHHSDDVGFFSVARHHDVAEVLRKTDVWSSRFGPMPSYSYPEGPHGLVDVDPPEHTAQRRLFTKAFLPRTINGMEAEIAGIVGEIMDEVAPLGTCDLMSDFAWRVPMRVIGLMLGMPAAEAEALRPFVADALEMLPGGPKSPVREWTPLTTMEELAEADAAARAAQAPMQQFFVDLIERRKAQIEAGEEVPPYDLVKNMVTAEDNGRRITIDEMLALLGFLLIAGTGTTALMIGNITYRLLQHPDQLAKLKADPALYENAIEESLRYDAPVYGLWRTNDSPTELCGRDVPKNSKLQVLFGSANRDADAWKDADVFNIERDLDTVSRHYAFGGGIHYCLGAPLARLEGRLALQAIVERMPNLRLDGDPVRLGGMIVKGFTSMPIAWGEK
jgi:cytochrome P450